MIAAYIRVSSTSQNSEGQKAEIKRWLKGQGIPARDVTWFEDKKTGRSLSRPAFQELEAAIFRGEIKTVVVWKLDRLSRNLRDGINTLAKWCDTDRQYGYGIRVVSVTQQLDFSGAAGKLIASVLLSVAEMELEAIKERQVIGINAAKKRGVYAGNGRAKGSTKSNPKRAIKLREQGMRPGEIAKSLGVSRTTVYQYLKA